MILFFFLNSIKFVLPVNILPRLIAEIKKIEKKEEKKRRGLWEAVSHYHNSVAG